MAQRTWLVRPDHEVEVYDGGAPIPAVSQQAIGKAMMDAAIILDRLGGVVSVTVNRAETGVPGERVTAAALVEWKDRTDARPAPERDGPPPGSSSELVAEVRRRTEPPNGPMPISVTADQEMPEVDETDVPPELRGG